MGSEQWIDIPVPALIDEQTFALVTERLKEGNRLSPRDTRRVSLLQGLLVCGGAADSAYYRSQTTTRQGCIYHYYRCSGTDASRRLYARVCANRPARRRSVGRGDITVPRRMWWCGACGGGGDL